MNSVVVIRYYRVTSSPTYQPLIGLGQYGMDDFFTFDDDEYLDDHLDSWSHTLSVMGTIDTFLYQ